MKKIIILLLLGVIITLTSCINKEETLLIGVDPTHPPFQYMSENGEIIGLNIDTFTDFLNENDEDITFLNDYLDKNPYCEVAWHKLGKQYFTLKQYEKSLGAFELAIISDETFVGDF